MQIALKEETWIQLTQEEFDFMADCSKGYPPEQPEERESRKEQRKSHKHDEPIILEGMIEDHQAKKMQSSANRFLGRNVPPFGDYRPSSNYGRDRKEQNGADRVCDSKMSFAIQRHNRKDQNEKPQGSRRISNFVGEGELAISLVKAN
ncbi:hypothetical protein Tco_0737146 [Tanacetum coccineum]